MSLLLANFIAIVVVFALALVASAISFWPHRKSKQGRSEWRHKLVGDLVGELWGAFFTALIFTAFVFTTEQSQDVSERQAELIRDARSRVNAESMRSVEELRALGWLTGENGVLQGADLGFANLEWVNLWGANLVGVDLELANLEQANCRNADLTKANLRSATIIGARFLEANLSNADLFEANLEGANLQQAYLMGANLQGANLEDVEINEFTVLPDGSRWARNTDLTRFTNPDHPNFWRSDDPESPAYRGDDSE